MSDSADDGIAVIISIAPIFCFLAITMGCVCGCRKQIPKNELLGLAGMVKITNPDDEFNYTTPQQVTVTSETLDRNSYSSHKRVNGSVGGGGGAVSRSLPDLPVGPSSAQDNTGDGYPDTTSDLYATLDLDGEGRKSRDEDGIEEEPVDTPGSPSYAQPSEERYARVGSEERIPAASAIAGIVPANHDLPYMTPPPQPNFSGDSHDSHKGYTSISVREPLSRIIMQAGGNNRPTTSHPHYATLSDVDSDDMYAAIEENNGAPGSDTYARIGGAREMGDYATSESETYAQIGPRVTTHADVLECREENGAGDYGTSGSETYAQIAPRPSRQDSPPPHSSQVLPRSNDTSPGSLRKEKREANSPLPEPPSPLADGSMSKLPLPNPPSPLDAMYAKVVKKQKSSDSNSASPSPSSPVQVGLSEISDRLYESLDRPGSTEPPYEKIQENRTMTNPSLRVTLGPLSTLPEPDFGSPHSNSGSISSGGIYSGTDGPFSVSFSAQSNNVGSSCGINSIVTGSNSCSTEPTTGSPVAELYAQVNKSPSQR